jgi:site-specific DNA recombinase
MISSSTKVSGEPGPAELDPERAPHIQWAFETYASGQWSITDLVDELARRGLRTRPTATRPAVPMTRSMIHRMLTSPYYVGRLAFVGVEYDGKHEALVDEPTWRQVQDVLSGRRIAGDRSWRHEHYLKGTLFCARCESRLGFGWSRGRSGRYAYFFCLGRSKKRTDCDLPYLPAERAEKHVINWWGKVRLASEVIEHVRDFVQGEMAEQQTKDQHILATQRRRLTKLERTRQKLIDAYLAEAIPVADLKQRQEALQAEQREAERLIGLASVNHELLHKRLDIALGLLEQCERLYLDISEKDRRAFNQAFFDGLFIDKDGVKRAALAPPFAQLRDMSIGFAEEDEDDDQDGPGSNPDGLGSPPRRDSTKALAVAGSRQNPTPKEQGPGSNLALLAERAGFEPATHLAAGTRFPVALLRPTRTPLRARSA